MLEDWPVGFSDPIYAEVLVKMHGFDILLGTVFLLLLLLLLHLISSHSIDLSRLL